MLGRRLVTVLAIGYMESGAETWMARMLPVLSAEVANWVRKRAKGYFSHAQKEGIVGQ